MKLTNYMRDAFVRSVMNDVPEVDYREQAEAYALSAAIDLLPPKVRAAWDDKKTREYVCTHRVNVGGSWWQYVPCTSSGFEWPAEVERHLDELVRLNQAEQTRRNDLRAKVRAVAYSAKTRQALADMLPEFEKYLPPDNEAAVRTLPVVANVVADLMAAGWPKEKTV